MAKENEAVNKLHLRALWITRTAVLAALLVAVQAALGVITGGFQLVVGSAVNLLLIISVMIGGFSSGLAVAVISPVAAKLFGIGPLWEIIPFLMIGNACLITVWNFIGNLRIRHDIVAYIFAAVVAAGLKCFVLYLGVVKLAIPFFLELGEKQAEVISKMFSLTQLFTALIGGALALIVLPILKKAIKRPGA